VNFKIIFTGVGGQGIIVASDIYCEAAIMEGFDVAKAETHGMAQRGGSIIAHVRIEDQVSSPLIEQGTSDVILGFEILETARALPLLKDKGKVIVNTKFIPPASVLQGLAKPPDLGEIMNSIRRKALYVYEIDGMSLAITAGDILVVNTVLLGALLTIPENPVRESSIRKAISQRLKASYLEVNYKALQLGKRWVLHEQLFST
jgi:indolepyruvate ferredoxin oxidoreductase beta subunit